MQARIKDQVIAELKEEVRLYQEKEKSLEDLVADLRKQLEEQLRKQVKPDEFSLKKKPQKLCSLCIKQRSENYLVYMHFAGGGGQVQATWTGRE